MVVAERALLPRRLRSGVIAGLCLAAVAGLTIGNLVAGGDVRVGFLYLPVLAAAGWWLSRPVALAIAAIAATALVSGDLAVASDLPLLAIVWNEVTRAVTLLAVAALVTSARSGHDRLLEEREQLFQVAITDSLTGLYNRRFLQEQLGIVHAVAVRRGAPYAVLALDIDGLKRVNDEFGHGAGDAALVSVAAALRSAVRTADVLARTGGDEFTVLLPDASLDTAAVVAERIHSAVDAAVQASDRHVAGVSVGSAAWQEGATIQDVLERADSALYANKRERRRL